MPLVTIEFEPTTSEGCHELIQRVTQAVHVTLQVRPRGVTVRLVPTYSGDFSATQSKRLEPTMPIVRVDLATGRDDKTKRALIDAITAAVTESLHVQPPEVRVLLNEVDPNHWAIGGETLAERDQRRSESGTG